MDENSYDILSKTCFLWKYFKIHHHLLFFLFLITLDKLIKAIVSFVKSLSLSVRLSLCLHDTTQLQLDGFLWDLLFENFFRKSVEIFFFFFLHLIKNLTRKTGTSHEAVCNFMIISRRILVRMRNVWDKSSEKIKTNVLYPITFFLNSCNLWDIWKNMVQPSMTQMTI